MAAWHYWNGEWTDGNPGIMGPMDHGAWLGSTVFDGARAFEGVAPDLDLHCERLVRSAVAMGLRPLHAPGELLELCRDGISRFPGDAELYIKPMYWATGGFVAPDPDTQDEFPRGMKLAGFAAGVYFLPILIAPPATNVVRVGLTDAVVMTIGP